MSYTKVVLLTTISISVGCFIALHLLVPSFDPTHRTLSQYVLSDYSYLAVLAIGCGGIAYLLLGYLSINKVRYLFFVGGIGLITAAIFPTVTTDTPYDLTAIIHAIGALIGFSAGILGSFIYALNYRLNYMTILSILAAVFLVTFLFEDHYSGLWQRLLVICLTVWILLYTKDSSQVD